MSLFSIRIRNYRNIPYDSPIEIGINKDITFIVGVNNVGKSNLLRMFLELRPVFEKKTPEALRSPPKPFDVSLTTFADNILNQNSAAKEIEIEFYNENFLLALKLSPAGSEPHTTTFTGNFETKREVSQIDGDGIRQEILALFQKSSFVPTLRTATNQGSAQRRDILIGPDLLNQFAVRSVGDNVAHRKQIETLIDELKELFGYRKFDIVPSHDKSYLIVKTDDGSFRLDELGEGIGHYIVVLTNASFNPPSYILIDEPENGLHPRMQELFIRTLASKASHGIIAASHAIGLARSVGDNIYSLTRGSDSKVRLLPFGEHSAPSISQSIYEMGYSQFVEIGGNHLLLVEGRTDIKSFREILRKYGIENRFIIWQLGGGSFILGDPLKIVDEFNELKRLNAKSISVIFDSERTAQGQALKAEFEQFKATCEKLGFRVFPTDYHSTENYITQVAIDAIVGKQYRALSPYEKFGATAPKWLKEKNWLMFREMKKEDFASTDLDKFIVQTLVPASKS